MLKNYLTENEISPESFATLIGVNRSTVVRYASGDRTPSDEIKFKIEQITNGAVPISAWFEQFKDGEQAKEGEAAA